jgi:hypothetical protein
MSQPEYAYFRDYGLSQRIGINVEDFEDIRIENSEISGDYDVGLSLKRGKGAVISGVTVTGMRGTGIQIGGPVERELPPAFVRLVAAVEEEPTAPFTREQVMEVLTNVETISSELKAASRPPNSGVIRRSLNALGAFFQHSANVTVLATGLKALFPGFDLLN